MDIVTIDSGEMALITGQIYGYLSAMDKAHLTLYPAEWYVSIHALLAECDSSFEAYRRIL